ncbi:MAG: STAS domain-containing protein [Thermomonas sp.]|uniref:STAS domain-containing protein n=1 Tax=Thermomonas sp. TaxID=1971895 RepID=UPI0039E5CB6A
MTAASLRRDGERLCLSGTLDRAAAITLWPQAVAAMDGARMLDVEAVDAVDSAGLAMLVALAERMHAPAVQGAPRGMDELLAAYRLTPALSFDDNRN